MGVEEFENKAKQEVEDRGGTDALKQDATEVKDDVSGEGSWSDKGKNVLEDVKDPGAPGDDPGASGNDPGASDNDPAAAGNDPGAPGN